MWWHAFQLKARHYSKQLRVMLFAISSPFIRTCNSKRPFSEHVHDILYEPSLLSVTVVLKAMVFLLKNGATRVAIMSPPACRLFPFMSLAWTEILARPPFWTLMYRSFLNLLCSADALHWLISPMHDLIMKARSASLVSLNMTRGWCSGCSLIWADKRPSTRVSKAWRRENWTSSPVFRCKMRPWNETAPLAASRWDFILSRCRSRILKRDCSRSLTTWTICSTWASTSSIVRFPACRIWLRTRSARPAKVSDTLSTARIEHSIVRTTFFCSRNTFEATSFFLSSKMSLIRRTLSCFLCSPMAVQAPHIAASHAPQWYFKSSLCWGHKRASVFSWKDGELSPLVACGDRSSATTTCFSPQLTAFIMWQPMWASHRGKLHLSHQADGFSPGLSSSHSPHWGGPLSSPKRPDVVEVGAVTSIGSAAAPVDSRRAGVRQIGQRTDLSDDVTAILSMHGLHTLCRQGRRRGSSNSWRHTGHTSAGEAITTCYATARENLAWFCLPPQVSRWCAILCDCWRRHLRVTVQGMPLVLVRYR